MDLHGLELYNQDYNQHMMLCYGDLDELKQFIQSESVNPYIEYDEYDKWNFTKYFRKGGLLEWYELPGKWRESYIKCKMVQDRTYGKDEMMYGLSLWYPFVGEPTMLRYGTLEDLQEYVKSQAMNPYNEMIGDPPWPIERYWRKDGPLHGFDPVREDSYVRLTTLEEFKRSTSD
jgi:hypothetical protein